MVTSIRSDPILQLGEKIVQELELDPSVDTLGRWMAHYLAELIRNAETAGVEDRPEKLLRCASAITDLWRHRSELPNGKRPFEEIEPILRALETLDPENTTPRYLGLIRTAARAEEESETKRWLDLADGFDYSARILIQYCLTRASKEALDRLKEWVSLAEAAGLEEGVEPPVLNIISHETDLLSFANPDEIARQEIEGRIERLEGFAKMANALLEELRANLKK
jgi:hypothetical protein